jgi:hypothetical protein
MSCGGCVKVVVKVINSRGIVANNFNGLMANGGCLSLETALQTSPGDSIRIESTQGHEAWAVKNFSYQGPKGPIRRNKRRYKYHVYLIPVRIR